MATTNQDRVGSALNLLSQGLAPFVERELIAAYGPDWADEVNRDAPTSSRADRPGSLNDAGYLLKIMWDQWNAVFRKVLGQGERTLVSELRDMRNRWAHQEPFSGTMPPCADSAHRLLTAIGAGEQSEQLDRAKQELLRGRFEEQARRTQRKAAGASAEGKPAAGLRPWREIVTPHPDVASGQYQQAEFAADLHRGMARRGQR